MKTETAAERRRNVRRCLDRLRHDLAHPRDPRRRPWEHVSREGASYPDRDTLLEDVRFLRAELHRQAAVIEAQGKVIDELREALLVDHVVEVSD